MPVDQIMLGVFNAYFRAAVESAAYSLKRSAYTTYIKESNDFATGLLTPGGEHFAYPVAIGAESASITGSPSTRPGRKAISPSATAPISPGAYRPTCPTTTCCGPSSGKAR